MNALGVSVLTSLVAIVLLAPRRLSLLALMGGVLFLPHGQSITAFGLNLFPWRFLELAAFVRVVQRSELPSQLTRIDHALIWAYVYVTVVYLLRTAFGYGTSADVAVTSNLSKFGLMIDVLLAYSALRGLITNAADVRWFLVRFLAILVPYVLLLIVERSTGSNPLSLLGTSKIAIWIDDDGTRVRCLGSFMHPSLLGTVGASFLLLYLGLCLCRSHRIPAITGVALCVAIVMLANSGGPLTFMMVGMAVWCLWPLRKHLPFISSSILLALVGLALLMNAPVWHLPTKMSALFGGSGWHRSYLMEQGFGNIDKWWLAGMPLDLTSSWFPYLVLGAADMTNVYLAFGVDGGLLAIFLFVLLVVRAFRAVAAALSLVRRTNPYSKENEVLLWGLGAVLAGHIVNFMAITYFDQTNFFWLMHIAAISSVTQALARRPAFSESSRKGKASLEPPLSVASRNSTY